MSAASTVSVSGDRMSIPRPSPTAAATLSSSSEPFPPPDSPSPATRPLLPDSGALGHAVAPGPGGHAMDLDCAPPPPASELPSSSSAAEVAPAEGCASSASSVRGDVHIGGDVRASAPVREGTSGILNPSSVLVVTIRVCMCITRQHDQLVAGQRNII
ncbi:hypothetical protein C8Q76DRAFT_787118 [Earliella scabrosa]|nr:hypothetical protein C8Q76DRAFT_787118 [Earliella scabrosa]